MGVLVEGVWKDRMPMEKSEDGSFVRKDAGFRNWVTADGRAGPTGEEGFAAETGRYHLYVSLACPWAHRTLIFRKLKGLDAAIDVSVVHNFSGSDGWTFELEEGATGDQVMGKPFMRDIYTEAKADYTGRVTVPVLWDKKQHTIVSNESSEIIRMFNSEFAAAGANELDFYPPELRDKIDVINVRIYETLNNGVYMCGFASTQAAYDAAVGPLFDTLDWIENILTTNRYLTGSRITEADWRLFTTLVRFDPVYHGHFKCNIKRLQDYPNLWNYTLELAQWPGVAETTNMRHIKNHYYASHESVNPSRIVPAGPDVDYAAPHDRARLS